LRELFGALGDRSLPPFLGADAEVGNDRRAFFPAPHTIPGTKARHLRIGWRNQSLVSLSGTEPEEDDGGGGQPENRENNDVEGR
jgi:hypothetical protein